MRIFRYISLVLTPLVLLCGCVKHVPDAGEPELTYSVPFSLSVQQGPKTRASFDGASLDAGNYVFSTGDKIYITGGPAGQISGELTLTSGAGTGAALFTGDLSIAGGFTPSASTELSATLVGTAQVSPSGSFFTITDHQISAGPSYPSSVSASTTLQELVQKYSYFTSDFTYNVRNITLTQQSVFLNFALELYTSDLSGNPSTVQVDIKNAAGNSVLHSVTDVPVGGNSTIARMDFTTVFPSGISLQGAQTWIDNGDGIHCEPDFAADLSLSANHYYRVIRSAIEEFTVEARSSGASVTFNYGPVEFRKYTGGAWTTWETYSSTISLSAGEKVSFRGQRTSYANTTATDNNNGTPLITVNNPVYIYGDIMGLICNENWVRHSTVAQNTFKNAFRGCANIDIHPDKDLILSADALGASCYDQMFRGCTGLTKTPILPATTLAEQCYNQMFQDCTGLRSLPVGCLPATTLALACYRQMFMGCSQLETVPAGLLPATTLANGCYANMFKSCGELRSAPELNATVPAPGCYFSMFRYCSKMKYLKCALEKNNFYSMSVDKGDCATPGGDTLPIASDMALWTKSTLWSVFNKWLNLEDGGYTDPKGDYYGQSALNDELKTLNANVGAVPISYWQKHPLP